MNPSTGCFDGDFNEIREFGEREREENHGVEEVKSKTVVKFSTALVPAPFTLLRCNTNLNLPPSNWLSNSVEVYGMPPGIISRSGFSSFSMANKFPDCVGAVDVVSDAENIKKLMKMTKSSSPVSLLIHRVEKTLLIDDFDLKKMLLASEGCWEWFRIFFERVGQAMQVKPENVIEYSDKKRMVLQQKRLVSKFLYHSLAPDPDATTSTEGSEEFSKADPNVAIPLPFVGGEPQLPEPPVEEETPDATSTHTFSRNVVWNFEDIQMLLGTDLPIFGGGTHPCVSLRLRDMNKPINVLTGMDYWLDNLMCNVPEVVMCYHLNGIVQRYELIKTEDIPHLPNSKFSPKVIRDIAQNILSFLKSNTTKAGHTYWLFKGRDDDVVKLYDLTSLCSDVLEEGQTPFTVPVAMLLYRVARNMKHQEGRRQATTIRTLLNNCVNLLPADKYPEIATSAHFMLADVYVPSDLNPKEPDLASDSSSESQGAEQHEDDYSVFRSMSLASMCEPLDEAIDSPMIPTPLSSDVLVRCNDSLNHVISGLKCLNGVETSEPALAPSVEAIPMAYETLSSKKVGSNANANNDSPKTTLLCKPPTGAIPSGSWSWNTHLKSLLYEKAVLIYLTLMEHSFRQNECGESVRHATMAIRALQLVPKARLNTSTENTIYGTAGDALLLLATRKASNMNYHNELYLNYTNQDSELLNLLKADNASLDIPSNFPLTLESLESVLLSSAACYNCAAALAVNEEQRSSFNRRLGNIENEIGVFYMNEAYGKVQENNSEENLSNGRKLLALSETHLEAGIAAFQKVEDAANLALLYSNTGRLMRLRAHLHPSGQATRSEYAQKERVFYNKAIFNYHLALDVLGERSANPGVWDSVFWELSTAYYSMATLLQDYPAGDKSHEEAERELTETLHKALKYCDLDPNGVRLPIYQFRCAEVHHRLASLHHSQFRLTHDESKRKHVLQLSKLHYEKASKLLLLLEYPTELLKIEMERIGLAELLAEGCSGAVAKSKHLLQALEYIIESKPMLEQITESSTGDSNALGDKNEQHKLLALMLQRLQFILLNLTKLAVKKNDEKKCGNSQLFKRLYSLALKSKMPGTVPVQDLAQNILTVVKAMQERLKLPNENIR